MNMYAYYFIYAHICAYAHIFINILRQIKIKHVTN